MRFHHWKRREFITLLGGAAAASLSARAQQGAVARRIGILILANESDPIPRGWVAAFSAGLQDLGWLQDRSFHIDLRFATHPSSIQSSSAELVDLTPDVILVHSSPGTSALRERTTKIPLVFVAVGDPVANGFVASIARPGGNITGFTNLLPSIGGKWVELLKEAAPRVTKVGLLFNPDLFFSQAYFASIEDTAAKLSVEFIRVPYRNATELLHATDAIGADANTGLLVLPPVSDYPAEFIARLDQKRLPAISNVRRFATAGGLLAYGADNSDLFRRASSYVDRILRGEKPGTLAVQFPTKFEMVLNLKAAKKLGLNVPLTLSSVATEVIE
ncbi:MAG: ABC transporter substrate-binding protein [Candidatus Sulfotelmatobacter sp.]